MVLASALRVGLTRVSHDPFATVALTLHDEFGRNICVGGDPWYVKRFAIDCVFYHDRMESSRKKECRDCFALLGARVLLPTTTVQLCMKRCF